MLRTTLTAPTALVLSQPRLLTTTTREGLRSWQRVPPPDPHWEPVRGRWGVLADGPAPDLVVAEHADPLLLAMLCSDLLRRARLLDKRVLVLVGERDDALKQLLAPLPLLLVVIAPTTLLRCCPIAIAAEGHQRGVRWVDAREPGRTLPRWAVVPLIPALARARSVAEAAAWCGIDRSTAYVILRKTARHLQLPRRWRRPRQWSRELLAALSVSPRSVSLCE